jgi:Zn-dependent peptidase ImmA (M78 family)
MSQIYRDAIIKAGEIRNQLGVDMFQPINIFDSCTKLGIDVKFVDVNMEGFYAKQNGFATILISSLRPLPRRVFTCGHELGHHVFNHGLKVDILAEQDRTATIYKDKDEILVDAFSAALLMPVGGVQVEFTNRNWDIEQASPIEFYTVASTFGVGYQTLITHSKINGLISEYQADSLSKLTPAKIFKTYFGSAEDKSYFRIIDEYTELSVIDLELSNYLILPYDLQLEDDYLRKINNTKFGYIYKANKAGISSVNLPNGNSFFLRIQRENYIGFADYRHFEN